MKVYLLAYKLKANSNKINYRVAQVFDSSDKAYYAKKVHESDKENDDTIFWVIEKEVE